MNRASWPGGRPYSRSLRDGIDTATILVVDDERSIVRFLHDLLESEGYCVQDAFDGDEAMSMMRHHPPHLVISDIMMPHASGLDLVRFIDRLPDDHVPKVIFMSANAHHASNIEIPLIEKPFDIDDLLALVDSTLENDLHRQTHSASH